MSGAATLPSARGRLSPWLWVVAGALIMYGPIYWWALGSIWQTENQGHGPIILAVLVWLFWSLRHEIDALPAEPASFWGWLLFGMGLLVFVVGRATHISILEFGSQLPVAAGVLLLLRGTPAIRLAWFPLIYMIFMVPLPTILVDAVTGPLKVLISDIVETLLYAVGYPIARSGVILSIGQYQLQVADACSGINSMFSLSALGTLFMYIMKRPSRVHNAIMLLAILPIAFGANIVRVIILVLITYYLGDEAGQGFLHGTAGMLLMLVSLASLFSVDALLTLLIRPKAPRALQPPPAEAA